MFGDYSSGSDAAEQKNLAGLLPWSQLRRVSPRLTERDREILMLLADARVLTTDQVQRFAFSSVITARHRLQELVGLRLLEVFRPHAAVGSYPNHYLLAPLGAAVVAAQNPDLRPEQVKRMLRRTRLDQQLALARAGQLAHLKGVNDFQLALRGRAGRVPGAELVVWQGERGFGDVYGDGFHRPSRRPDGFGMWREDGRQTRFLLEYDRGTETLQRLAGKLGGYREFFGESAGDAFHRDHGNAWLLFCFLSERREHHARPVLREAEGAERLSVATAVVTEGIDPGGEVWLPLARTTGERCTLAGLPAPASLSGIGHVYVRPSYGYRPPLPPDEDPAEQADFEDRAEAARAEELAAFARARQAQEADDWGQEQPKSRWGRRGHG
jgi:hypothetical protein